MYFDFSKHSEEIISTVLSTFLIIAFGILTIKIAVAIEKKALKRGKLDKALHTFIVNGTKIILLAALLIMLLQNLGISTSSLIAILGAGGAAIALALKDSLANVAGGILILINKPFGRGDEIEIKGSANTFGVVDEIDLLVTKLHTWDNKKVSVPNGMINTSVLLNYTASGLRRVDEKFSCAYGSDIDKVKEILRKAVSEDPIFVKEPAPIVGLSAQGRSALVFDCKVWTKTETFYEAGYRLKENVKKAFDRENISIPYTQIDIHTK